MKFYFYHSESDARWEKEFDDIEDAYAAYSDANINIMTKKEYDKWEKVNNNDRRNKDNSREV